MEQFNFTPIAGLEDTTVFPGDGNPRVDIMVLLNQLKGFLNEDVKTEIENANNEIDTKGDKATGTAAATGQIKIPFLDKEFIIKWGAMSLLGNTENAVVTFAEAFPNALAVAFPVNINAGNKNVVWSVGSPTKTGFNAHPVVGSTGALPSTSLQFYWIAIGY